MTNSSVYVLFATHDEHAVYTRKVDDVASSVARLTTLHAAHRRRWPIAGAKHRQASAPFWRSGIPVFGSRMRRMSYFPMRNSDRIHPRRAFLAGHIPPSLV